MCNSGTWEYQAVQSPDRCPEKPIYGNHHFRWSTQAKRFVLTSAGSIMILRPSFALRKAFLLDVSTSARPRGRSPTGETVTCLTVKARYLQEYNSASVCFSASPIPKLSVTPQLLGSNFYDVVAIIWDNRQSYETVSHMIGLKPYMISELWGSKADLAIVMLMTEAFPLFLFLFLIFALRPNVPAIKCRWRVSVRG